jgi:hypothetical protein
MDRAPARTTVSKNHPLFSAFVSSKCRVVPLRSWGTGVPRHGRRRGVPVRLAPPRGPARGEILGAPRWPLDFADAAQIRC